VEQRTDETARRPGAAAEDTGPPGDKQPGTTPAAGETTAETNGDPAGDREPGWEPQGRRGPSFTPATPGSFGSSSADPPGKSGSSSASGRSSSTYPSGSSYSGNNVDDGYGPPGGERPATDFPSSSVASQTFGAAPAESVYGSSGQRDYSPSPYPSQVTASRPQAEDPRSRTATPAGPASSAPSSAPSAPSAAETTRTDRPSAWQAATSRMPRPQQVPKKPKPNKRKGDGASARQAHLMVSRFEPWSVMKFSFMISLACFVILFVAVALLYGTLAGLGVFDAIQKALSNVTSGQGTGGVSISKYLSASTILSYTALLGVLNVFLITAFATVGSLVYNLTAHLIGGVEVTLQETE
jgi:Transmembrane domain of unknown function (DUF3566)